MHSPKAILAEMQKLSGKICSYSLKSVAHSELATLLILLPPLPELSSLRSSMAQKLQKNKTQWPMLELEELFMQVVALRQVDKAFISGKDLAYLTIRLIESEETAGGPYVTKNKKPTIFGNALIVLFLKDEEIELSRVIDFLKMNLTKRHGLLPRQLVFIHFVLAHLQNAELQPLLQKIFKQLNVRDLERFDKALLTAGATVYDYTLTQKLMADYLKQAQSIDRTSNLNIFADAAWLAALYAYDQSMNYISQAVSSKQKLAESLYGGISSANLPENMQSILNDVAYKIQAADSNYEIALLPYYFLNSIHKSPTRRQKQAAKLFGIANIYCWMAYTIYDDFIDDEGKAFDLPVANIAMRQSLSTYLKTLSSHQFKALVYKSYDAMDSANSWELKNCRAVIDGDSISIPQNPDYKNLRVLSERASGHVIGVRGCGLLLNFTNSQMDQLELALHHFLIARQLNDDIHDWREDFFKGHLTYVVSTLLKNNAIKPGVYSLSNLTANLEEYFWNTGHPLFCRKITYHVRRALKLLGQIEFITPTNDFTKLIQSIEESALKGLAVQQNQKEFLAAYQEKNITGR